MKQANICCLSGDIIIKISNHLDSVDVRIAVFVKVINQPWQHMVNSQSTVVQYNYQPFVLLFTHTFTFMSSYLHTVID